MISTEERPKAIPSALAELGSVPLSHISNMTAIILDEAIKRVIPESPAPSDTPFNSAI